MNMRGNFDGAALADTLPQLTLDLTSRTGTLAALRWLQLYEAVRFAQIPKAGTDAFQNAEKECGELRTRIEAPLKDWVLAIADDKNFAYVAHQGTTALDMEIENDGPASFLAEFGEKPPAVGVWILDGKVKYRRIRTMEGDEWDVEFDGDWREASAVDLAIMGVDYGECMHVAMDEDEREPIDFAQLVGHPAFKNDWLAQPL
jgi:hypothetical protein